MRAPGLGWKIVDASFPLTEKVELYGRVENVFDVNYQTVADYGTWGRVAYLGIRARY